jgi:hypothetical protein
MGSFPGVKRLWREAEEIELHLLHGVDKDNFSSYVIKIHANRR